MILKNQFNNIQLVSSSLLECFDNITWEKKISIWNWTNRYASVIHSSNVNYEIETVQENSETDFFFLVSENIPITIDADIIMQEWVQKSSASLLEESILLSKNVNIKSLPVLDIHSKNIQASHWAKIYRLDDDKLFYLESKWLNKESAENLILSSFWERMFNLIEINEEEKDNLLKKYFISR